MARGFHKPGDEPNDPQDRPAEARGDERPDRAPRHKDSDDFKTSNPRDGKSYGDDQDRTAGGRPRNPRIGRGYGTRHDADAERDTRPPRPYQDRRDDRREFDTRPNYRDDRRDRYPRDDHRGPRDFDDRRGRDRGEGNRFDRDRRHNDWQDNSRRDFDRGDRRDFRNERPYRNDRAYGREDRYDDRGREHYRDERGRDHYRSNDSYRGREDYRRDGDRYDRGRDERYDRRRDFDNRGDYNRRWEGDRGAYDRRQDHRRDDYRRGYDHDRRNFDRPQRYRDSGDRRDGPPSRSQEWRRGASASQDSTSTPRDKKRRFKPPTPPNLDPSTLNEPIRLNKFLARSTSYSRRDSDDLIKRGRVTVNDEVVAPGHMVQPGDIVLLDEKPVTRRDHLAYILINKPKGVATTTQMRDDADAEAAPSNLGELLKFKGVEQLTAVNPLEEDMLGLQLVSNDPRITEHFAKYPPKETYTLALATPGAPDLPQRLVPDATDEGHPILVAEFADDERQRLSIVVRGGFPSDLLAEAGLDIERADRLHFAGLTKKDLPRGHWRFLSDREITWVSKFQQ